MFKLFPEVYLSTAYMPPIQYFTKILAGGTVFIEQHENFVKQSYRTRCDIYAANGVMQLNIPIERGKGEKVKIKDIRIDYSKNWQHVHWQSIVSAYQSSPFFEYYSDDFLPFYQNHETYLFDFNNKLLNKLLELIGIKTNIVFTEDYVVAPVYSVFDYRQSISPKPRLQQADPNYRVTNYYQVFENKHGFIPNLSIFDLLCNEGNNTISVLQESVVA